MPCIATIIPMALTILAASVQQAQALGCYNAGLGFKWLHGGKAEIIQEVRNDIHTTCSMAAGKIIKGNEPFWLCTNWEKTISPNVGCFTECMNGCAAMKESIRAECNSGCDSGCERPAEGGFNHIDWAIEVRGGQPEHEITYEDCTEAFNTEVSSCQSGSEQNHHDFWFRIDPAEGKCP